MKKSSRAATIFRSTAFQAAATRDVPVRLEFARAALRFDPAAPTMGAVRFGSGCAELGTARPTMLCDGFSCEVAAWAGGFMAKRRKKNIV